MRFLLLKRKGKHSDSASTRRIRILRANRLIYVSREPPKRKKMNKCIREFFNLEDKPYYEICREEQNLCALLYHLLLVNPENLQNFLELVVGRKTSRPDNAQIYVEFAYLRDTWKEFGNGGLPLGEQNQRRRHFILSALGLDGHEGLRNCSVEEFNAVFIKKTEKKKLSFSHIQSPSSWSITQFDEVEQFDNIFRKGEESEKGNQEFLRAARFKWCFNVKPDIVIFTSEDKVISIEAKFESVEGKYPSSPEDKKRFKARNLSYESQTKIQKEMFELLGIEAHHVFVTKKGGEGNHLSWKDVFGILEVSAAPTFLRKQIDSALSK